MHPWLCLIALVQPGFVEPGERDRAAIEEFLERLSQGQAQLDSESLAYLRARITDLRIAWAIDSSEERAISYCLLDLLSIALDPPGSVDTQSPRAQLRQSIQEVFASHLDADFERFLAREVLGLAQSQPLARRQAALWLLSRRPSPGVLLALLSSTRDADDRMRSLALEALSGWPDSGVHGLFLGLLERPEEQSRTSYAASATEQHFARVRLAAGTRESERLKPWVARDLARSGDWRAATRALLLARALDDKDLMPLLIPALEHWKARSEAGLQSLRILREIELLLEERTGQKLGFEPIAWKAYWSAVERGERAPRPSAAPDARTRPGFFKLELWTDRVTFVIDRSGSMSEIHKGEVERSRWREAVAQLVDCVQGLGPTARFNVVLFHDYADPWREELVAVTPANVRALRGWLEQTPGGGTQLKAGIEAALWGKRSRERNWMATEADTLVLLCDGATEEGPGWVASFLERVVSRTRTRFHGVQIGSLGDGTLEALARGSGGQAIRSGG